MTNASRQSTFRKRVKDKGLISFRIELESGLHQKLRNKATGNCRTMKQEVTEAIQNHLD